MLMCIIGLKHNRNAHFHRPKWVSLFLCILPLSAPPYIIPDRAIDWWSILVTSPFLSSWTHISVWLRLSRQLLGTLLFHSLIPSHMSSLSNVSFCPRLLTPLIQLNLTDRWNSTGGFWYIQRYWKIRTKPMVGLFILFPLIPFLWFLIHSNELNRLNQNLIFMDSLPNSSLSDIEASC